MSFDASNVAAGLRKAMKGFGTDDKALIKLITTYDNDQLQEIREAYQNDLERDLIEDIKSETSGDYERVLVGLVRTRAEFDAHQLNKAVKGVGTDEDVFIQTLCHRNSQELADIEDSYLEMFGKTLKHDIEGDFSGDGQKVAIGLITYDRANPKRVDQSEVDEWVEALYDAGEGKFGTDEETFAEAICGSGPNWLRAMNETYGRKHGHTLVTAVAKEFSGFAAKALEAMVKEHDEYYADLLHEACDGVGTNEELLTRVLVSRRHRLRSINNKYMYKYQKSIKTVVEGESGGNVGKVFAAIVADI